MTEWTLEEIATMLDGAERNGTLGDSESSAYISISDELARQVSECLRTHPETKELVRLVEQIDFVGYESKGRPLELDPNFKRLAEMVGGSAK